VENMDRKKYIENDVLCLAECLEADNKILYESWNEHETIWGYNWKIPHSFDEYCTNFKNDNSSNSWSWGAVIMRLEDNAVIGRIGLSAGLPDLTITIFKAYRNQQYGTMAFLLGVRYCFEILKLDKIYAGCFEDNIASRKMIEQCGFKRNPEGDDIEGHIFTDEDRLQLDFMIENPHCP